MGPDLIMHDVDRIFIATNYEEEDLEENDDNSLCRFEWLEIIARLAKAKFLDHGVCKSVASSTRKLITDFILPNTLEQMDWQPFRDNLLWTLDVDDLFKANLANIGKIFTKYTRGINPKIKFLTKDALITMVDECGAPLN